MENQIKNTAKWNTQGRAMLLKNMTFSVKQGQSEQQLVHMWQLLFTLGEQMATCFGQGQAEHQDNLVAQLHMANSLLPQPMST